MPQAPTAPVTTPQAPVQTRPTPLPSDGGGDHDRFAHYVPKRNLTQAIVEGMPVRALCGKVWVPSRDPERYPVCPTCKEIRERMLSGDGADGDA